jgi:hypothetical protein
VWQGSAGNRCPYADQPAVMLYKEEESAEQLSGIFLLGRNFGFWFKR